MSRFADLEETWAAAGGGKLLVAFSGGGDSVALLHLLAEQGGPDRLHALIVDHALREGSAHDARHARDLARAIGVEADILTLTWPGGANSAQAAARMERYRALCTAARARGAHLIAVAHTADDQAETVLMRAAGGSAWRGLAGMAACAPAPVWPEGRDVLIARPLLAVRRAELRGLLRARGAEWIEDPANANPAFERVRVRARLAALESAGFDPMRLTRLTERLRRRADAIDAEALALIAHAARFERDVIILDLARWEASPDARLRALSVLIAAAAGAARESGADAVARLAARLAAGSSGGTLGGARLRRQGQEVALSRDPGALLGRKDGALGAPPLFLPAGVETVWDGRLALCAAEGGFSVHTNAKGGPLIRHADGGAFELGDRRIASQWLLEPHVRHRLGPHSAKKTG